MKELRIDIADLLLVWIAVEIVLHYFLPVMQIIPFPYRYLGIALFFIGWIPSVWIWAVYRKAGNPVPARKMPNKLIISGLFRITRNPNYLGMLISLIGEAIFLGSLTTFIVPVLFIILINRFNIAFEEENLERIFGKTYLDYKRRVRRWI
jgi:protein-S-isoprenylcysteine O-methyltransferase Ste14